MGKTHLLSSLRHAAPFSADTKVFCTFVELTNLVGALGFATTVAEWRQLLSNTDSRGGVMQHLDYHTRR